MSKNNMKSKVFSSLIWRFAERCGAQFVGFFVSIILARLLSPDEYGTIALITVFTRILQVFVDSGLGNSLIQKKDADDTDFSTVFYTNIVFCTLLYSLVFFGAPLLAKFYNDMSLTPVVRALGLTILISGVKNVQQAYVSRNLMFKRFFFSTLGGTIAAAVIGVAMAYMGFGVWALVAQQVINLLIDTVILWMTVKWRPKLLFSFSRLKRLFSFGWKLLVSKLLDTVYADIRQLVIGKMYSPADLAFYTKAKQFPQLVINNLSTSIDSVLFPAMANVQNDKEHVKSMMRRSMQTSIYLIAPIMMGMAFVSKTLIRFVLTEKWIASTPFLVIFSITFMFQPLHTANLNAIKALGRSDLFLKLEIIKKIVGIIALLCTMWFGVMAMAYSLLVTNVISQIINTWPNKKLLNYSYIDQLKDIMPSILLSIFMGFSVSFIALIGLPDFVTLIIQCMAGICIYAAGSKIFRFDSFDYVWGLVMSILKINKKHEK